MAVSEDQLATWAKQGSITQSAATYQTVRAVLEDTTSPYRQYDFDIFLQGSYGNDTNIYKDSDVDIAIRLSSTVYSDTSELEQAQSQKHRDQFSKASYQYEDFKKDVLAWLRYKFGSAVKEGKKAIRIPAGGGRRDVDVLVCARHLDYGKTLESFNDGIVFWSTDGAKTVNYPKQHLQNCTSKNQMTSSRFKGNVRTLKNMRNRMIDLGYLADKIAPSYFLEGMLSNIPNDYFSNRYQETFENYMHWLDNCNKSDLTCANNIHWLLREAHSVCWRQAKFEEFRTAALLYWRQSSH